MVPSGVRLWNSTASPRRGLYLKPGQRTSVCARVWRVHACVDVQSVYSIAAAVAAGGQRRMSARAGLPAPPLHVL